MNIEQLKNDINEAVAKHNIAFYEKHKDNIDFGTCGSAVTLVAFGRKRKVKKLFEEAGLLGTDWDSFGRKAFCVDYNRNAGVVIGTQNIDYYEGRARVVTNVIKEWFEQNDIDAYVHTHVWID